MTERRYYIAPSTGGVMDAEFIEGNHARAIGTTFHPVVVIDPEDREQVERLTVALHERTTTVGNFGPDGFSANEVANALREFIKPPKPEEPTGLGAVVEDADGAKWIRVPGFYADYWAQRGSVPEVSYWRTWSQLDAVRVLSEGVQS